MPACSADCSKQAIGALVAHMLNMVASASFAAGAEDNECLFYLVNFVVDCVIGLVLNLALMRGFEVCAVQCCQSSSLESGNYGDPPKLSVWLSQLTAWLWVVILSKAIIVFAFILPLKGPLYAVVEYMFAPIDKYPQLELLLIMIVIPLVLNVIVFWIQDQYLMQQQPEDADASAAATRSMWAKDNFDGPAEWESDWNDEDGAETAADTAAPSASPTLDAASTSTSAEATSSRSKATAGYIGRLYGDVANYDFSSKPASSASSSSTSPTSARASQSTSSTSSSDEETGGAAAGDGYATAALHARLIASSRGGQLGVAQSFRL